MSRQTTPSRATAVGRRFAYAACAWALGHAAMTTYWALGGTVGLGLLSEGVRQQAAARRPGFVAVLWGVVALKVLAGLFALALVRREGERLPRWLRLTAAWGTGVLLTAYAAAGLGLGVLVQTEILSAADQPDPALKWYLGVWYPLWLLGGLLFLAAAWSATIRREGRVLTETR